MYTGEFSLGRGISHLWRRLVVLVFLVDNYFGVFGLMSFSRAEAGGGVVCVSLGGDVASGY